MATRSYIGVRNQSSHDDDSVTFIYCHFDGYPEHNGDMLINHYKDIDKVNELMGLGDLSSLDIEIGDKHDFNSRHNGWCTAYGRDRGESNTEAKTLPFSELVKDDGVDFLYVFNGNEWECYNTYDQSTIDLYSWFKN